MVHNVRLLPPVLKDPKAEGKNLILLWSPMASSQNVASYQQEILGDPSHRIEKFLSGYMALSPDFLPLAGASFT